VMAVVLVALAFGVLWYSRLPRGAHPTPTTPPAEVNSRPPPVSGPGLPSGPPAGGGGEVDRGGPGPRGEAPATGASVGPPGGAPPPRFFGPQTSVDFERQRECGQQVGQLAMAVLMYAVDYDDHLPLVDTWCDGTYPYVGSDDLYRCPAARDKYGYALNRNLSHARTRDLSRVGDIVMLFESSAGRKNASDTGQSLCNPARHHYGNNVGYLDGHFALSDQPNRAAFRWR
jgi:hypothetical protein